MFGTGYYGKRAAPSFFDELPADDASGAPPVAKRPRFWDPASPPPQQPDPRARCATADPALVAEVSLRFPAETLGRQLIEKALVESGNDLGAALKILDNLHLGSLETNGEPSYECPNQRAAEVQVSDEDGSSVGTPTEKITWPLNLELPVNVVWNSSGIDDAKARASRVIEGFQKTLHELQKENSAVKERLEALIRENSILKSGVAIQYERQKDYDEKNKELQQLKQHVAQYQEQVRNLERSNFTLSMQLKAKEGRSIPWYFHPDVF